MNMPCEQRNVSSHQLDEEIWNIFSGSDPCVHDYKVVRYEPRIDMGKKKINILLIE